MSSNWVWMTLLAAVVAVSATEVSAGDHGSDDELEHRVQVEDLSGFNRWLGELYNDNRWLFAVVVTATMALMGTVIALVADVVLKRLGLGVKPMRHGE